MSTSVITLSSYLNGSLTDLTSIEFASEDGTYGLKRIDNGDSVIAFGTAVDKESLGTYQASFTDPAADLEYEYTLKIVYAGTTYYHNRTMSAGNVDHVYIIPAPATHYSSQAEVARQIGVAAIDLMNEDWESNDTSPVWEDILSEVDEAIDLYISHKYSRQSFSCSFLRRIATKMTCYLLSGRRGNPNLYRNAYQDCLDKLQDVRNGRLNIPNLRPIGNTGPVVRNYIMQPTGYHPMRVETLKSTGDSYSRMDIAYQPYLITY